MQYAILPSGLRLRIAEQGPASGAPVLLLHGWGASAYMFRGLMSALAAAGFHAIAPDFRGHGLSDKPSARHHAYATERLVDDTAFIVRLLCPDRVSLVGQSMGGAVAIKLAAMLGDRIDRMALIGPAGLTSSHTITSGRLGARLIPPRAAPRLATRQVTAIFLRACYADPSTVKPMEIDEYWAPSQFRGYARALRALLLEFDWGPYPSAMLATVTTPTLVFGGDHDRVIPGSEAGAARLPNGIARRVERAGHLANAERPEVVNGAIVEFFRSAR